MLNLKRTCILQAHVIACLCTFCEEMPLHIPKSQNKIKRSLAYQGHSISEVGLYEISFGIFQLFLKQKKSYEMKYCFSTSADHQDGE